MIPAEKIKLFSAQKQPENVNPQQIATSQLLQISDEDYRFDPFALIANAQLNVPKLQKRRSAYSDKSTKLHKHQLQCNSKCPIQGLYGKTPNHSHKQSSRYISGEEVCVMKKEKVVNLSNFLMIDWDKSPEKLSTIPKQGQEESKASPRAKPPKNIINFIRRRNLSYLKQQAGCQLQDRKPNLQTKQQIRSPSPLRKAYASCQLKKLSHLPKSSQSRVIMQFFQRPINGSAEMSCTSPNFRNRKMSNYMNYRMGMSQAERHLQL